MAVDKILKRLGKAKWSLFSEPEERWYRADYVEHGQNNF